MTIVDTSQDSKAGWLWTLHLSGAHYSTEGNRVTPTANSWSEPYILFYLGQNKLPFPLSLLRVAQLPVFKEISSSDFLTLCCWIGALWHSPQRVLGFGSSGDEGPHLRALLGHTPEPELSQPT